MVVKIEIKIWPAVISIQKKIESHVKKKTPLIDVTTTAKNMANVHVTVIHNYELPRKDAMKHIIWHEILSDFRTYCILINHTFAASFL